MMLRILIHVLLIIFLFQHTNAQERATKKRLYEIWVTKTDGTKLTGLLNDVDDTKLLMDEIQFGYIDVYAHEIDKIQFRNLYQSRIGMVIGALAGLSVGIAIGSSQGTSSDCQGFSCIGSGIGDAQDAMSNAFLYGIGLGAVGAGAGAALGSIKINIPINGSADQFKANKARISKYLFPRQYYE